MCAPAAIIAGVGLATQIVGQVKQSQSQKQQAKQQAAVDENNSQFDSWLAGDAIARGRIEENASRQRTAQLKGTQRATLGARGIDLTVGSAEDILSDTDYMGEIDALTIRQNAEREAYGYSRQAAGLAGSADNLRSTAGAISPATAGLSTLLTGAGQVASAYYQSKGS